VKARPLALAGVPLAALAVIASGCGVKRNVITSRGAQRLDVVLDGPANADHVGLFAARAKGYFRRVHLDVHVQAPPDPAAPLQLLRAHRADLVIVHEPDVLLARDRGMRVVAVGALVQRPLTSIIALPSSRVTRPADLAGKTVGTAGLSYQSAYLQTIARSARVGHVTALDVGFDLVRPLLSKRVAATLGAWNIEGVDLARRHRHPTVIRIERAGVPTYDELVLAARQDELGRRGDVVRRFVRALGQGYGFARRDPQGATAALVRANPNLDGRLARAQVRATLPVFDPGGDKPFGYQDPRRWRAYAEWMRHNGLVRRPAAVQDPQTNEFLAGQGI
jgi:putative hydroxymethylpyrimidine transport system substrate-binding protein